MWQDVAAMWEADTAAEWERINEPIKPDKNALESLKNGLDALTNGCDWLADAASNMDGDPLFYRVESILESMGALANELENVRDRYERGV